MVIDHLKVVGSSPTSGSIPECSLRRPLNIFARSGNKEALIYFFNFGDTTYVCGIVWIQPYFFYMIHSLAMRFIVSIFITVKISMISHIISSMKWILRHG
jgi:hypothetical protein